MTIKIERTPALLAQLFTYAELCTLAGNFGPGDIDDPNDPRWMGIEDAEEFLQSFRDALTLKAYEPVLARLREDQPVKAERYHSDNPMVEELLESACKCGCGHVGGCSWEEPGTHEAPETPETPVKEVHSDNPMDAGKRERREEQYHCGYLGGPCTKPDLRCYACPEAYREAYTPDPEATYIDCSGSMRMNDEKMALLRFHTKGDEFFFTYKVSRFILDPSGTDIAAVFDSAIAGNYKYIQIVTDQDGYDDGTKIIKSSANRKDPLPFKIDWRVITGPS